VTGPHAGLAAKIEYTKDGIAAGYFYAYHQIRFEVIRHWNFASNMFWTADIAGGPRRVNHAAVGLPGRRLMFVFGGYCTGDEYNKIDKIDVHVFNLSNFQWCKLKEPSKCDDDYQSTPYMRYGHTASLIGCNIYIFGGRNDQHGACNILYCFNTNTFKWSIPNTTGTPPGARDGHSSCVVNTKLYIFGGYKEVTQQFSSEMQFLESETMTWHYPIWTTMNLWRDFHTCTSIGNKIYLFGGRGDSSGPFHTNRGIYDNAIYEFDTEKMDWTQIKTKGKTPKGRRSHSAVEYKGNLFIFGGYNERLKTHFADMWKFDPAKRRWTEITPHGNGPCARRRHSCCMLGDEFVLFGGTCPTKVPVEYEDDDRMKYLQDLSDVYLFEFCPRLTALCKNAVLTHNVDYSELPSQIRNELERMRLERCRRRFSKEVKG